MPGARDSLVRSVVALWLVGPPIVACGGRSNENGGGASGGDAPAGSSSGGATGGGGALPAGGGGTGGVGGLPPGNARERELLDPLSTDDATIYEASGRGLIELAQSLGLARGYALCRCVLSPTTVPEDVEELVSSCARDESGPFGRVGSEAQMQCLLDGSRDSPHFDEYTRCHARQWRATGLRWLETCVAPGMAQPPGMVCDDPGDAVSILLYECGMVSG
jgi:hypothetical protein